MQVYRCNWPVIVIIDLQTHNNIIPVLYDKVIIIAKNFERTYRLSTSDFQLQILGVRLWTSVSDLDN